MESTLRSPVTSRPLSKPILRRNLFTLLGLEILALILRLPFRSPVLVDQDSVNLALGLIDFNVIKHRPHPPGYILYIAMGKLIMLWQHDANASLITLNIIAGLAALAFIFVFAYHLFGFQDAVLASLLFMTNPLTWWYEVIAQSHPVDVLFSVAIAYVCYRALEGSVRWAYLGAILLGVAGGFRQTTLFFMLTLAIYTAWQFPWRHRFGFASVTGLICLGWVIPLFINTGGIQPYLTAASQLNALNVAEPLIKVLHPLFYAGNVGLVLAAGAVFGLYRVQTNEPRPWDHLFLAAWVMPGLLFLSLRHIGQSGHVLFAIPALILYTPALVRAALGWLDRRLPPNRRNPGLIPGKAVLTVVMILFIQMAAFLMGGAAFDRAQAERWGHLQDLPARYTPEQTVVLTDMDRALGFRLAYYYFPAYHVYSYSLADIVGPFHLNERWLVSGWVFHSFQYQDNYDLNPDTHALNRVLELPAGTTGLILTNEVLARALVYQPDGGAAVSIQSTLIRPGIFYASLPAGVRQIVTYAGKLELR